LAQLSLPPALALCPADDPEIALPVQFLCQPPLCIDDFMYVSAALI
jgi:hypothetical protein